MDYHWILDPTVIFTATSGSVPLEVHVAFLRREMRNDYRIVNWILFTAPIVADCCLEFDLCQHKRWLFTAPIYRLFFEAPYHGCFVSLVYLCTWVRQLVFNETMGKFVFDLVWM